MSKHVFMDLDGTITPPRQKIQPHIKAALSKIGSFVVISGLPRHEIEDHLDGLPAVILAQQGNDAPDWQNTLTLEEALEAGAYVERLRDFWLPYDPEQELFQNRGGVIAFSFTGHFAPQEYKDYFDPQKYYRRWLLNRFPFESKTLDVRVSGSTTIDFTRKDCKKGDNIRRYIELHGLNRDDCVYYGDALFPGGNDESVIGVIKTVEVTSPNDLITKL